MKGVIQATVSEQNGIMRVAPNAQITIRNAFTGNIVSLWTDRAGTIASGNPFYADANGFFRVYSNPGTFEITAQTADGSITWEDVIVSNSENGIVFRNNLSIFLAPSGTMGNNGAVTLGTALLNAYPGLWLHFPSNAIYAGSSAGMYWTVMSTTTAGTVYNNTYNPATEAPTRIASPTPFVTTGPGAYTGTTTNTTALSWTLPGGSMGRNGVMRSKSMGEWNNSAGSKSVIINFGAVNLSSCSGTTNNVRSMIRTLINQDSESIQYQLTQTVADGQVSSATTPVVITNNTATDLAMSTILTRAVATDVVGTHLTEIKVTYGA